MLTVYVRTQKNETSMVPTLMWYTKGLQISQYTLSRLFPTTQNPFCNLPCIFSSARLGSSGRAFCLPSPVLGAREVSVSQRVVNLCFLFSSTQTPVQQHKALCCLWTQSACLIPEFSFQISALPTEIPSRYYKLGEATLEKFAVKFLIEIRHVLIIWPNNSTMSTQPGK